MFVLHQATISHFGVAELAFDYLKRMFYVGPEVPNLAVERIQWMNTLSSALR
jgi:hypothetical protein